MKVKVEKRIKTNNGWMSPSVAKRKNVKELAEYIAFLGVVFLPGVITSWILACYVCPWAMMPAIFLTGSFVGTAAYRTVMVIKANKEFDQARAERHPQ